MDCMTVRPLPVGLAYVAAHLDTARHPLQVLDLMFTEDAIQDTVTAVQHFQPDVGIGVVNKLAQYYYATADAKGQSRSVDWRMRPAVAVVEEVRRLRHGHGIQKVFFIDSGFNTPLHHAKALCQALIEADLDIRWHSYLRPGECDAELIELMQRSGCALALLAGTEGYSAESADLGMHLERVGRLTTLCSQEGLPFTLAIGFGTPGETRTTVERRD
jgi:hypothetical protein